LERRVPEGKQKHMNQTLPERLLLRGGSANRDDAWRKDQTKQHKKVHELKKNLGVLMGIAGDTREKGHEKLTCTADKKRSKRHKGLLVGQGKPDRNPLNKGGEGETNPKTKQTKNPVETINGPKEGKLIT